MDSIKLHKKRPSWIYIAVQTLTSMQNTHLPVHFQCCSVDHIFCVCVVAHGLRNLTRLICF